MSVLSLTVVRGLPGAGKSTYAAHMAALDPNTFHIEADQYFTDTATGEYKFDPSLLDAAHRWCQMECFLELQHGYSVIVSNTFTRRWEIRPYIELARKFGAMYFEITLTGNYKSVHDVPADVVQAMHERWEW